MQLLSSTASWLRQAVARGWRALGDVHRNQARVWERYYRYYRPQREWAVARSHDSGMPSAAGTKSGASGPDRSLHGCGRDPPTVKGQVTPVTQDGHRDAAI
jgi:hypothetical protein